MYGTCGRIDNKADFDFDIAAGIEVQESKDHRILLNFVKSAVFILTHLMHFVALSQTASFNEKFTTPFHV